MQTCILFQQQEVCPHIREHADQLTGSRLGEDLQISGLQDLARPGVERMALPSVQAPCVFCLNKRCSRGVPAWLSARSSSR